MTTHSDEGPEFEPDDPLTYILRPTSDYLPPPPGRFRAVRRGAGRRRMLRTAAGIGVSGAVAAAVLVALPLGASSSQPPASPTVPLAPPAPSRPAPTTTRPVAPPQATPSARPEPSDPRPSDRPRTGDPSSARTAVSARSVAPSAARGRADTTAGAQQPPRGEPSRPLEAPGAAAAGR